jgi:SAM-dependent methyltransferase
MAEHVKRFATENAAVKEFERAQRIYQLLQDDRRIATPRPLRQEGPTIVFEALPDGCTSYYGLKNNRHFLWLSNPEHAFDLLGRGLAALHMALGGGKIHSEQEIHGDFWSNNTFIDDTGKVYVVDFSPSLYLDVVPLGSPYRDLAQFIVDIKYKYPLAKYSLRNRKTNDTIVNAFLAGYSDASSTAIDELELRRYLVKVLQEKREVFGHKNFMSRLFWQRVLGNDISRERAELNRKYSESHKIPDFGKFYDSKTYGPNTPESYMWNREKRLLDDELSGRLFERYLDFACGTGRLTGHLCRYARSVTGVDISPEMISAARSKRPDIEFVEGDIIGDAALLPGPFDLVTCFRFLLNAEQALREDAMEALSKRMGKGSVLIVNNHGGKFSARLLVWFAHKVSRRKAEFNSLSDAEVGDLLERHDLSVHRKIMVSYLLKSLIRLIGWRAAGYVDAILSKMPVGNRFAINTLYICSKK